MITASSPSALADIRAAYALNYGSDPALRGQLGGCPDDCIGSYLYGFIQTGIAAGAQATIVAAPQKRNVPRRLFLSETVADNFTIDNIVVGVEPVLATAGAIAASAFVPNSLVPDFVQRRCEVSMNVTVTATNISGAAATFAATMSAYLLA